MKKNTPLSNMGNLTSYSNLKRKQIFKPSNNQINYEPISKTLNSTKKPMSPNQLKKSNQSKKNYYIGESKNINLNFNLTNVTERNIKKDIPKNNIEISLSSVNSNETQNTKIISSRSNSYSKNQYKEILKYQDEILELKLQNGRLQNENKILIEKNKSLNNIIDMKSTENEILTNKYSTLISDLKQDNINLKEINERDIKYLKELNEKQIIVIKSLINFSIEVFELLMSASNNNFSSKNLIYPSPSHYKSNNNSTNNNIGELSIDIYDSNGCEEERKILLIEQIKELFLAKLNLIKKNLNIHIDTSFFERVKDFSSSKINYSNITNSIKKNNNDDFNISLSKSCFNSNDNSNDFDLSVSKSFYNITNNTNNNSNNNLSASPKFNSFCDNIKSENKNEKTNNENNNILPLMLLSETKSLRGSFGEYSSNSNGINKKFQQENSAKRNINILDYSIGDIVNNGSNEKNEENKEEKLLYKIDSFANIKSSVEEKKSD